jgi:SAM-dependent methyltransferase
MTPLPKIHLCIVAPPDYVHSLGFLDQARYFRWQFRRMGAQVSLAKNRLREDSVNIVFGAHLGFDPQLKRRHTCLFVNLEQLGAGGARVRPEYLTLLRGSGVIEYEAANIAAYSNYPDDVPIIHFAHAPYLEAAARDHGVIPLEARPIDLLFFGSMNPRRREFMNRIESTGLRVTTFDGPLYGAERDQFLMQAKAVVNCHFYETNRFEQARAFHCLSLGTPLVSERTPATSPPGAFEDAVFWLQDAGMETWFKEYFKTPQFYADARARLQAFKTPQPEHDPLNAFADVLAFAAGYHQSIQQGRDSGPWRPTQINLGSGKDYKPGWLNIDILERAQPDLVLDLGQAVQWPVSAATLGGGEVRLESDSVDCIYANNVLEHVPDLPQLMTNALALLREGGELQIEVPYEKALTAWQDPTHLRALNENSWLYYTDWFWYLGWFGHRFEITASTWLDEQLKPCPKEQAAFMRVKLRKVATTPRERTQARLMQPDFGGVEDDFFD